MERFERFTGIIGEDNLELLKNKKVLVIGCGGVGGSTAIHLARSGIGRIDLIDFDTVSITNINRQVCAYTSTIGRLKVDVIKELMMDINPDIVCNSYDYKLTIDDKRLYNMEYDYVVDAVDDVKAKISLIKHFVDNNIPIISSMGAGNRMDPTKVIVTDISKTHDDPLSKVVRTSLRKLKINHLNVVFSLEIPGNNHLINNDRIVPSSSPFVPNAFGIAAAYHVVKELIKGENND